MQPVPIHSQKSLQRLVEEGRDFDFRQAAVLAHLQCSVFAALCRACPHFGPLRVRPTVVSA